MNKFYTFVQSISMATLLHITTFIMSRWSLTMGMRYCIDQMRFNRIPVSR